ncbi:uncharacterized protein LOC111309518 [Durio zibethinus]|uniref:Uncharacterized protein LOC111309518 n=1 Tax=Durio zibethinus TaxID=66656 RepID=A0A6P6AHE1_DURZI|nr:uncharacterized protein LOC111309518 [Durio zibethinus]
MAAARVTSKLLIDQKSQRVLFAEAGKDFVDFLFNMLSLPVGTVIRLLTKQGMVGCLGNLYGSIENLDDTYMQSPANKDTLLKPLVSNFAARVLLLLPNINMQSSTSNGLYRCRNTNCRMYVANDPKSTCPSCDNVMNQNVTFVNPTNKASSSGEGGYVKGVVTYMIMDDLVVRPMSTISSITLLNRFNVKDVGVLEERVIDMGMDEGVKLLRASMQSRTVLTEVFLGKKVTKIILSMATNNVSLKHLVDTKGQRVLFAEAGKDFVDFLFYMFSPTGHGGLPWKPLRQHRKFD